MKRIWVKVALAVKKCKLFCLLTLLQDNMLIIVWYRRCHWHPLLDISHMPLDSIWNVFNFEVEQVTCRQGYDTVLTTITYTFPLNLSRRTFNLFNRHDEVWTSVSSQISQPRSEVSLTSEVSWWRTRPARCGGARIVNYFRHVCWAAGRQAGCHVSVRGLIE